MIRIIKCNCVSQYQDEKYGKDNRAANITSKDKNRCSVCGKEK